MGGDASCGGWIQAASRVGISAHRRRASNRWHPRTMGASPVTPEAYARERADRLRRKVCMRCGRPRRKDKMTCGVCSRDKVESERRRWAERLADSRCVRCERKVKDAIMCKACLKRNADNVLRWYYRHC